MVYWDGWFFSLHAATIAGAEDEPARENLYSFFATCVRSSPP